jgi:hypothetical protein
MSEEHALVILAGYQDLENGSPRLRNPHRSNQTRLPDEIGCGAESFDSEKLGRSVGRSDG